MATLLIFPMEVRCPVPILCMCQWGGCPCVFAIFGEKQALRNVVIPPVIFRLLASMMTPRKNAYIPSAK